MTIYVYQEEMGDYYIYDVMHSIYEGPSNCESAFREGTINFKKSENSFDWSKGAMPLKLIDFLPSEFKEVKPVIVTKEHKNNY